MTFMRKKACGRQAVIDPALKSFRLLFADSRPASQSGCHGAITRTSRRGYRSCISESGRAAAHRSTGGDPLPAGGFGVGGEGAVDFHAVVFA